jgi:peptide/nickel transport system permease protein
MRMKASKLGRQVGGIVLTAILGGVLTAALVRNSPGADSDERLLDARLNAASLAAIRSEHGSFLRADFWMSPSLKRPISELIAARLPVTLRLMGIGLVVAWGAALLLAALSRSAALANLAGAASTCALCLPSAVLALLVFMLGGPAATVIPLVLFPRLFETVRNVLSHAYTLPHIMTARANGVTAAGILMRHALPVCAPELLALAGVSVVMAFGAAIPVETLCDVPGLGQLAWKAATARDLPLLVTLTLMMAVATQTMNAAADWLTA